MALLIFLVEEPTKGAAFSSRGGTAVTSELERSATPNVTWFSSLGGVALGAGSMMAVSDGLSTGRSFAS